MCAADSDHTYEYPFIAQAGGPVTFMLNDGYRIDNAGSVHITIYKSQTAFPPGPPPSPSRSG
jgi:hypothetical protein